jgi:hypothetical protein
MSRELQHHDICCLQDYVGQQGRLNLHGMDADIDVMIESKAKELSILLYRYSKISLLQFLTCWMCMLNVWSDALVIQRFLTF